MTNETRSTLRRRGLWLEYLTIGWNVVEGAIAIAAGVAAGSVALVGFGFDSTIEVGTAVVVVWQFQAELRGGVNLQREGRALKLIAVTFFVLAAYVTFESVRTLITREIPDHSTIGIVLAAASLVVMPTLAWFKRHRETDGKPDTARGLGRDVPLRLAVGDPPRRTGPQLDVRLVVG